MTEALAVKGKAAFTSSRPCCFSEDRTLLVTLVEQCNQACLHCMRDARRGAVVEWSTTTFAAQIEEATSLHCFDRIIFSGGEPTLLGNLNELIALAAARCSHITLCTNGTRINAAAGAQLRHAGLTHATVGVEGTWSVYDRFRGTTKQFEHVARGVEALVGGGIVVTVNITLWNGALGQESSFLEAFDHTGIRGYSVSTPILTGRAEVNSELFSNITHAAAFEFVAHLRKSTTKAIDLRLPACNSRRCGSGSSIFQMKRGAALSHCPDYGFAVVA